MYLYLFHFALRNHCIPITTDTLHIIGTQLHNNLAISRTDTTCLHNNYYDYEIGHVTVYIKFEDEITMLTATKTNVEKKNEKQATCLKHKNYINYFRPILTLLSRQVVTHTERPLWKLISTHTCEEYCQGRNLSLFKTQPINFLESVWIIIKRTILNWGN